jgi:signal transduction histidine kinase/ABC-type uncharacterized transport system substrate-binding protein
MNIVIPALVVPLLALMPIFLSANAASATPEPHRVLVLHSVRGSLPANADWYAGIVRGFTSEPGVRIELDVESPDLSRAADPDYVSNLLDVYRRNYGQSRPKLIIATYTPALQFLLEHGDEVFPGIPIVFCGADGRFVATQPLPQHITGITTNRELTLTGTLKLITQIHPDLQRIAVIVGAGDFDRRFEQDARQAVQRFAGSREVMWLRGLPFAELAEAVKTLPARTAVLYVMQLEDRAGRTYTPQHTVGELSRVTRAPIYGLWDTLLGHGITGGRLATLEDDGFLAAQMGLRILKGEAPAAIPVVYPKEYAAILDGKELARWNIDESQLPGGSRILGRQRSLSEDHSTAIIAVGAIIGIQGLLIVSLLLNRGRLRHAHTALQVEQAKRAHAEEASQKLQNRLRRISKQSTLGALTTGIAHEVNQPLIAIKNYAQAAKRRAEDGVEQLPKLIELLGKMEGEAVRAGNIIEQIRSAVTMDSAEPSYVSLQGVVEEVLQLLTPELESQGVRLDFRCPTELPAVVGDSLQLQLVLINLLHNAMHGMETVVENTEKVIAFEIRQTTDRELQVNIADRGKGVPADVVEEIFEPMYSEDPQSLGMGLAICRTIIEAPGGRIWHTANPAGGAIFHFTLRVAAA